MPSSYTKLINFLNSYRVDKSKDPTYTHTSMGKPAGSYYIPSDPMIKRQLTQLMYAAIFKEKKPIHLTEKPPQVSMLKIDLDFKFNEEIKQRLHTSDLIRSFIQKYNLMIRKYLDLKEDDSLISYVFERQSPYQQKGETKDGIHIMYPYLICDTNIQHVIREAVVQETGDIFKDLPLKNSIKDVIDKAVISTNNWLMFGCSKPGRSPYELVHIYDSKLEEVIDDDQNQPDYQLQLMELLSIREPQYSPIQIKTEYLHLADTKKIKIKPIMKSLKNNNRSEASDPPPSYEDVELCVSLLSADRFNNRNQWIEIGLALHNINSGNQYLRLWVDRSRHDPKFQEGECEKQWSKFTQKAGGLFYGSLRQWAKQDNPIEYQKSFQKKESSETKSDVTFITKLNYAAQTLTHVDLAEVICEKYKGEYIASGPNSWYQFIGHKWELIDDGADLRTRIRTEICDDIDRLINFNENSLKTPNLDQMTIEKLTRKKKELLKLMYTYKNNSVLAQVIKICNDKFRNSKFLSLLDSKNELIGFENGVFDLTTFQLRDGLPNDYIFTSVGYNYNSEMPQEHIEGINKFFFEIFPNEQIRSFVWRVISSCLIGKNTDQKLHIWTGRGGNGKSKLIEFLQLVMGDYIDEIPVEILTNQNKSNGEGATPQIAKLQSKRIVTTAEPSDKSSLNGTVIKGWTGNDKLSVRKLFGNPFSFIPQFKLFLLCNKLPMASSTDGGLWRRILVVPFTASFCDHPDPNNSNEHQIDPDLDQKFKLWKITFMNMLINEYKIYKQIGLSVPDVIKAQTNGYRRANDDYQEFMDIFCESKTDECVSLLSLFRAFKASNCYVQKSSKKDLQYFLEYNTSYKIDKDRKQTLVLLGFALKDNIDPKTGEPFELQENTINSCLSTDI
jgi:P4 family phage/plasmid primase-like protien